MLWPLENSQILYGYRTLEHTENMALMTLKISLNFMEKNQKIKQIWKRMKIMWEECEGIEKYIQQIQI